MYRLLCMCAEPASCLRGTVDFSPGDKIGWGVALTTHLNLVPKVKTIFDPHSHTLNVILNVVLYIIKPSAHVHFYYGHQNMLVITVDQVSPFPPIHATVCRHPDVYRPHIKMYISLLCFQCSTADLKILRRLLHTSANI
jgi:hypothetical protein